MKKIALKILWIIFGLTFLFILSPYFDSKTNFEIINEFNVFQFSLAIIFGKISGFILPGIFLVFSLCAHRDGYVKFFTIFVSIFAILNALFMTASWSGGIHYEGWHFVIKMTILNIISFSIIYLLIWLGNRYEQTWPLHLATLIFSLTLALIAFPWFGEGI